MTMDDVYRVMLVVVAFVALGLRGALAAQHVVGGSQGWDTSTDLSSWASSQTFKVGDQLVFKYTPGLHSVVELGSEKEYTKCDMSNAVNSMNGGSNAVKLDKAGERYFTCGTLGHCQQGMKVKIKIAAADGSAPAGSASSSPGSASSTPASANFSPASIVVTSVSSLVIVMATFVVLFGLL